MNKKPEILKCGARIVEVDRKHSHSLVVTPPGPGLRDGTEPNCTKGVYYFDKQDDTRQAFIGRVCTGQPECELYWAPQDLLQGLRAPKKD